MSDLRKQIIRLAYENPELRPHLLPLVGKEAMRDEDKPSALSKKERKRWTELSDRDAESTVGRAKPLSSAEKKELKGLTKRMEGKKARDRGYQKVFNPADYFFRWTDDWYEWDSKAAHRAALKDRNAAAKAAKAEGRQVRVFSLRNQRITRGGIGTRHPEIFLWVTGYGMNVD